MKRTLLAGIALAGFLAACTTVPKDAAQSVYALEGTLTAAINVATIYAGLPTCGGATLVCSDPATVARIKAAASSASSAVLAAQASVTDPKTSAAAQNAAVTQAGQAVAALTTLTASVRTQ